MLCLLHISYKITLISEKYVKIHVDIVHFLYGCGYDQICKNGINSDDDNIFEPKHIPKLQKVIDAPSSGAYSVAIYKS